MVGTNDQKTGPAACRAASRAASLVPAHAGQHGNNGSIIASKAPKRTSPSGGGTMRHYVVVANQTLGGEELVQTIRDRMADGPSDFWIVVPATPIRHLESDYVAMPVMGGMPLVQASPEEAEQTARAQLESALQQLRATGATVDGAVGDADPVRAVQEALVGRQCDEIIVSTLPARLSRW